MHLFFCLGLCTHASDRALWGFFKTACQVIINYLKLCVPFQQPFVFECKSTSCVNIPLRLDAATMYVMQYYILHIFFRNWHNPIASLVTTDSSHKRIIFPLMFTSHLCLSAAWLHLRSPTPALMAHAVHIKTIQHVLLFKSTFILQLHIMQQEYLRLTQVLIVSAQFWNQTKICASLSFTLLKWTTIRGRRDKNTVMWKRKDTF